MITQLSSYPLKRLWFLAPLLLALHCPAVALKSTVALTDAERAFLGAKDQINMCTDPDWMPYMEIDENGNHHGIIADFHDLLSQRIGKEVHLVQTNNWAQSLELAKQSACDVIAAAAITPMRQKYLNFTRPILSMPLMVATRTDQLFIDDFTQVADKSFAIVKNFGSIEIMKKSYPRLHIIEVETPLAGLRLVQDKSVFGYIDTLATIGYQLQKHDLEGIKITGKLDQEFRIAVAVCKDLPLLHAIYEKGVQSLSEEDKSRILQRWLSVRFERGFDYILLWKIIAALLFLTGALALICYIYLLKKHRHTLQVEVTRQTRDLHQKNQELQQALVEIQQLSGLLPICASCKMIRDDQGYWSPVEQYISKHTQAKFTHSICPKCMKTLYPDVPVS